MVTLATAAPALPRTLPLPRLLVLTDGRATGGRPLLEVIAAAVDGGARGVVLREKHLERVRRRELAAGVAALLAPVHGVLVVASDPSIPADGVHLAAGDLLPQPRLDRMGRSCHSAQDVARAAAEGCRWATVSPVFPTASKPGYGPALGIAVLRGHAVPVWALGGVDPTNAASCMEAGASGIAVMGAVMRAEDPGAIVADLCRAIAGFAP